MKNQRTRAHTSFISHHWSPLTHASHCTTTSSHIDESESKPSHAHQGIFMPDALPAATLPIYGLGNRLRICWLAYLEALCHFISVNHFVT